VYGELGRGHAECHHTLPLSEAAFVRKTRLRDLAIVCANCHRMLHRGRPRISVEALRELMFNRRIAGATSPGLSHAFADLS
jgi:5-methylcytosine-specific restriction enzyme A